MGVDQRVLLVGGGSEDLGEELEQAHLPFRFQTFRCWEQLVSDSQEKIDIILAEDMPKQGYEVPGDPPLPGGADLHEPDPRLPVRACARPAAFVLT